jgi:hypothetical protein
MSAQLGKRCRCVPLRRGYGADLLRQQQRSAARDIANPASRDGIRGDRRAPSSRHDRPSRQICGGRSRGGRSIHCSRAGRWPMPLGSRPASTSSPPQSAPPQQPLLPNIRAVAVAAMHYCRARFIPLELAREQHRSGQYSDPQNDRHRDDHDFSGTHAKNVRRFFLAA